MLNAQHRMGKFPDLSPQNDMFCFLAVLASSSSAEVGDRQVCFRCWKEWDDLQ